MGTPVPVGYGARRHVPVDAGDGHRHAAEHGAGGAPIGSGHLHRAVAHPHARPARALDGVDMVERPVTEENDDIRPSCRVSALQGRLQPAPLGRPAELVGKRREGIRRAQHRSTPGRNEIRRTCVPRAALGGLHRNGLGPGRREEHGNGCQGRCQHCARTGRRGQHGRPARQQPGCPPPRQRVQGAERGARRHAPRGGTGIHLLGRGGTPAGAQATHNARPPESRSASASVWNRWACVSKDR